MMNHRKISTLLVALASLGPVNAMFGSDMAGVNEPIDVKDRYIVTFSPNISEAGIKSHLGWVDTMHARSLNRRDTTGFEDRLDVGDDFHAYIGHYDEATVEELRNNPDVTYVEEDRVVSIATVKTQTRAGWALHSMANRGQSSKTQYLYHESAGEGTYAYVIDNGIDISNPEFEGRAEHGYSAHGNKVSHFHGTTVAGIIGSKTYGVAKKGNLVSVQPFGGTGGKMSDVLKALEWAVKNATETPERKGRSVINMSMSAEVKDNYEHAMAISRLVKTAVEQGVHVVVCAGNDNQDARKEVPAGLPYAITVGGITENWTWWHHSNYGPEVDVSAPAENVMTTGLEGATVQQTGTSFASPHVAGLAMYLLGKESANNITLSSPEDLKRRIVAMSTKNKIKGMERTTPNRIAFNGAGQ
ncbi:Alkaline protease 1 [Colletotrichum gloeosporioides]|uniref:Alkaline protease 1 n=1 Tax=Colletotrichum gloeosporioides TaxID=474922 RepID=A0A8H4C554_COLGL|nr:Alkaline protease 1 [Colletotrichum gloeosporioides]KAF3797610.1 Alkaline protease 1 [Colletotrichum gloeosporioides]